jgi:ABC-2 type transport system permease protein
VFRALLHAGAAETTAYRGEVITWLLSTTQPLIMAAFFSAICAEAPLGRFDERSIGAYFLAAFIVRTATGSFVSRRINLEIRDGTLATRLLRPVHPLVAYTAESVAAFPTRLAVIVPASIALVVAFGRSGLSHDPLAYPLFVAALAGAFALSLLVSLAVGGLAFYVDQSDKVMDAYLTGLFVLSGYMVPIELFPASLRALIDWLPFRYQIGLPVEILVGALPRNQAIGLLLRQWTMVAVALALVTTLWRRGFARYTAHGG